MDVDEAWSDFADRIKAAGELITGEDYPQDPRLRAEGYRYVARLWAMASQLYLEFSSADHPTFFRYGDDVTTFGATNVDNQYLRTFVDPAGSYRISGDVAGSKEILFSVQDGEFLYGKTAVLAECSVHDLDVGDDGRMELFLGGPERERNWLPLGDDAVYINIRQFVADWEHDTIAELFIERLDDVGPSPSVTPESIAAALDSVARWVEVSVPLWNSFAKMVADATPSERALAAEQAHRWGREHAARRHAVGTSSPAQALLIELEQPETTYWSFQTYMPGWMQPLDFPNRVTSLNDAQVHVDDDGKDPHRPRPRGPGRAELARHHGPAGGSGHVPLRPADEGSGARGDAGRLSPTSARTCRRRRRRSPQPTGASSSWPASGASPAASTGSGVTTGRLDGKVAIITGASSGLGPVMGAMFVREGAKVVLAARREALVQEAAAAAGDGAIGVRADVTNEDDVAALVARAVEEFGQVDVLCNNAAAPGQDTWIWEQTLENWNATIDIDVTAAMLCTREVLRSSRCSSAGPA